MPLCETCESGLECAVHPTYYQLPGRYYLRLFKPPQGPWAWSLWDKETRRGPSYSMALTQGEVDSREEALAKGKAAAARLRRREARVAKERSPRDSEPLVEAARRGGPGSAADRKLNRIAPNARQELYS